RRRHTRSLRDWIQTCALPILVEHRAVIFGDSLKRDAPPEIAVNLNVPVVPAAVGGIAPAFFVEQPKYFAQEIMAIPPFLAPKYAATQAASRARAFWQMFVLPNDVCRRA